MQEPDSTTPGEFVVNDEVFIKLGEQLVLGTVMQVNGALKNCLVKFLDGSEILCDFSNMKLIRLSEREADVTCVVCKDSAELRGNNLVRCNCGRHYHQKCHQPPVAALDQTWRCRICSPKRVLTMRIKPLVVPLPSSNAPRGKECMKCGEKDIWHKSMVQCRKCSLWIHGTCLYKKRSILPGDRFYIYLCGGCNRGRELLCRLALTWIDLLHLALFNLGLKNHNKYHDLDTSILPYLNEIWSDMNLPAEIEKVPEDKRRNYVSVILRSNNKVFKSGREDKKRVSLWKLRVKGAPRPSPINLPAGCQLDESNLSTKLSHMTEKIVPWHDRPLQNGFINSSRKADSDSSCSPPDPGSLVESSTEFLVKRSKPFPLPEPAVAADRFRSNAVKKAARLLISKTKKPPSTHRKEDEPVLSLKTEGAGPSKTREKLDSKVKRRPQRNLLEARLNSTENKLYNPTTSATVTESPPKKKQKNESGRKVTQRNLCDGGDEKIRPGTRQLKPDDIIVKNGVVKRRRRTRKVSQPESHPPLPPPPPPSPPAEPECGGDVKTWDELIGPPNPDLVREALSGLDRIDQGNPYRIFAIKTTPTGEVFVKLQFLDS